MDLSCRGAPGLLWDLRLLLFNLKHPPVNLFLRDCLLIPCPSTFLSCLSWFLDLYFSSGVSICYLLFLLSFTLPCSLLDLIASSAFISFSIILSPFSPSCSRLPFLMFCFHLFFRAQFCLPWLPFVSVLETPITIQPCSS